MSLALLHGARTCTGGRRKWARRRQEQTQLLTTKALNQSWLNQKARLDKRAINVETEDEKVSANLYKLSKSTSLESTSQSISGAANMAAMSRGVTLMSSFFSPYQSEKLNSKKAWSNCKSMKYIMKNKANWYWGGVVILQTPSIKWVTMTWSCMCVSICIFRLCSRGALRGCYLKQPNILRLGVIKMQHRSVQHRRQTFWFDFCFVIVKHCSGKVIVWACSAAFGRGYYLENRKRNSWIE